MIEETNSFPVAYICLDSELFTTGKKQGMKKEIL